ECVSNGEDATADSTESAEVGGAASNAPEITRERTHVRASATCNRDLEGGWRATPHEPLMYDDRDGSQLEWCPGACRDIRSAAGELLRRVVWRPLLDVSRERLNATIDVRRVRWIRHATRVAGEIIRRRLGAETDGRVVHLGLVVDELREACRASDEEHEQTGGKWVERTSVTNTP